MKALVSGDHHFDECRRFAECIRVHDGMVRQAREQQVDVFISGGDVYERASTPAERAAVARWLVGMAEVCPVLIAKGNHDRDLDCALMARLRSKHPIIVEEGCGVHIVAGAAIALIAWPERARILAHAQRFNLDAEALTEDALRSLFAGLGQQLAAHDGPKIVAGHFMVDGSVTSVGQPLLGQPMRVSLTDFSLLNADIVLMGHIHRAQDWMHDNTPIVYTGSPYRTSYGELEDKSVVLVDFPDEFQIFWHRLPTACAGMHLVSERWDHELGFLGGPEAYLQPEQVLGSEIRLRYEVSVDDRESAAFTANEWKDLWLAQGALDVKVEEEVATTTRARAPEVAAALTLGDKLLALWNARGTTPEAPRQDRLISMAAELETNAS